MAIQQNFPSSRPSLSLNFARSKKLDPRITFTRTSSATYVGEDGLIKTASANAARFDHDPITGDSLGLFVEESRSNLFTHSEDFSTGWGTLRASVTTNIIAAPDGSFTADKLTEDTTPSSTHLLTQGFVYTSGVTYTATFFVKAGERSQFQIRASTQATFPGDAIFNLSTGTATSLNGTSSIVPIENGWYRCSVTAAATANGTTGTGVYLRDGGSISYNGDGTSGIYIWGAQLEQGAFPTSYIPTTASTVTRTADRASMTGTNFSSWYNPNEGSVYIKYNGGIGIAGRVAIRLDDTTLNNFITIQASNSGGTASNYLQVFSQGSQQTLIGANLSYIPGKQNSSISYKNNDFSFSRNGVFVNSSSSGSVPLVNSLGIGQNNRETGIGTLNGTISQLTYYPSRLKDNQLITLTK